MWKHILGQSIYQIIVIFILLFTGENFIPESKSYWDKFVEEGFDDIDTDSDTIISGRYKTFDGESDYEKYYSEMGPSRHLTVIFNTFVMMQIFNELNARKIEDELNIFSRIFASKMFVGIWVFTLIV